MPEKLFTNPTKKRGGRAQHNKANRKLSKLYNAVKRFRYLESKYHYNLPFFSRNLKFIKPNP